MSLWSFYNRIWVRVQNNPEIHTNVRESVILLYFVKFFDISFQDLC